MKSPSFTRIQILNLIVQALYLLRQHGRPRFNAEYGRVLFTDEQAHFFFLSIVLLNATPSLILLAPFAIRSLLFVGGGLKQLLPCHAPLRPDSGCRARWREIWQHGAASAFHTSQCEHAANLFGPQSNFYVCSVSE